MSTPQLATESVSMQETPVAPPRRVLRVWPAVVIAAAYWLALVVVSRLDLVITLGFFSSMIASLLAGLLFTIWFYTRRAIPGKDRILLFLAVIVAAVIVVMAGDSSVGIQGLLFIGPGVLCTAWAVWLLIARNWSPKVIRNGLLVALALAWGQFLLVRINGIDGFQQASVSPRWTKTAEDLYLAQRASESAPAIQKTGSEKTQTLALAPGDWPGYRGENREGELHGVKIATNWKTAPPKLVWKQRIGPAWSSFVVVGDRLFTQEQRGKDEAVVCLDAANGKEIWAHLDESRWSDGQGGAGPRSSPVFADGRIYSMGAKGVVNCLDAATGQKIWTRNVVTDFNGSLPMWGYSSSPLVTSGVVIVFAGGPGEKGLVAYRVKDGEPAWSVATGPTGYSSPQLVKLGGESQVLYESDAGLVAVEPVSGTVLWKYETPPRQMWRVTQPRQVGDSSIIWGAEDVGLSRLELAKRDGKWTPTVAWQSQSLHPSYNDFVYQDGFVYGLDKGLLCCVDAKTGERRWKAGRYGFGQILLLADQKVLFVIEEYGKGVLVAARPDKLEELGSFDAISGKTWNHPVIAHGRLYARNSEEIACYQLAPPETRTAQR